MADQDNLLRMIRMSGIFSPDQSTPPYRPMDEIPRPSGFTPPGSPLMPGDEVRNIDTRLANAGDVNMLSGDDDINSIISRLYTPEHTYSDLYSKTFNEMPQRKEPGLGRKILGNIAAFSGQPGAKEGVLYRGYNRDLADWETKMKYLQPAMTYERYANANERAGAYQTAQATLNERKLALAQQKSDQQYQIAQKKLDLQALRDQGWTLKTGDDGYIWRVSKQPGSKPESTGVKSDELSDYDKIKLRIDAAEDLEDKRQQNRLDIQANSQDYGREMTNLRNDVRDMLMKQQYELALSNRLDTYGTPVQAYDKAGKPLSYLIQTNGRGDVRRIPLGGDESIRPNAPGASSSTTSETQKAQGITNKATQVVAENPGWKPYVKFDPKTGKFLGLVPPKRVLGRLISGPDEDNYANLYQTIYGEPFTATPGGKVTAPNSGSQVHPQATPTQTTPNGPTNGSPANNAQPKTGKVKVIRLADGKEGTWDYSQGPLDPKKYKVK